MIVSSAVPATHAALKITGTGAVALYASVPTPVLEPSEILVRVVYISINHVDVKSADMSPSRGATSGTDFSGVVVALGSTVEVENHTRPFKLGERVLGGVFGNNPLRLDNGAFAEFVAVPARLVWHAPQEMDFATAATLPAALATVGLALFRYLQLPMPSCIAPSYREGQRCHASPVLVYGGSTATGAMAIQVLKLAGFTPITACSAASAARARSLGAAATFDYHSPTCGVEIREHTAGLLAMALDCITDTASMRICYEALGPSGGRYVALDSFPLRGHTRRSVRPDWVCTYTQFGHAITWAPPYNLSARPNDREAAEAWYTVAQCWLDENLIKAHPREERSGGLAAVGQGMEEVKRGQILGRKLVYRISEELR
ncbi:uncharacterized protein GIQ15_01204 [Arthroderma uncinatum]|uniref:uncharacterized protein n=1 Tax=Arthroderma uncinatum TaxID=74035 RepID=UPI00144A6A54|nr:uncharacterized protein GIQ15_01204 [Arthroderma uncinatum]KAF3491687.1 hypothetical protein GIQ15_01204 [Arthroderma uncinatum]